MQFEHILKQFMADAKTYGTENKAVYTGFCASKTSQREDVLVQRTDRRTDRQTDRRTLLYRGLRIVAPEKLCVFSIGFELRFPIGVKKLICILR